MIDYNYLSTNILRALVESLRNRALEIERIIAKRSEVA